MRNGLWIFMIQLVEKLVKVTMKMAKAGKYTNYDSLELCEMVSTIMVF
jgi:hypothetical protein